MISTYNDKVRFADTVSKYLPARYELGARGPHSYDCLTFIWHFYNDFFGIELPEAYGDWTAANYRERYLADKQAAREVFADWLRGFGRPVAWDEMSEGDVVFSVKPAAVVAFVCIGRRMLLGMDPKHGATVVGADALDLGEADVEVRRG